MLVSIVSPQFFALSSVGILTFLHDGQEWGSVALRLRREMISEHFLINSILVYAKHRNSGVVI